MKPANLLFGLTASILTAFAAVSADTPPADIPLRFVDASGLYDSVKQQLGPSAASAVVSVDIRTNVVRLDAAHPDTAKVRELITKLDKRPPAVMVAATVKRLIPATPTAAAREEIISRPTMLSTFDRPMKLSFADGTQGTIEVELVVTLPKAP